MHLERKALYNLLRMNWLRDPQLNVEPWQVADYRQMPLEDILASLQEREICIDPKDMPAYVDEFDSPEELTDALVDEELSTAEQDQVYLLLFELWRRLTPENRSLSIFCDELDHQINLYDREESDSQESIQDAIANLALTLDEGSDQGVDPIDLFDSISSACANDVESFLYDFISECVDNEDDSYASELIDTFYDYVSDVKWFDFLRARIAGNDYETSTEILQQIYEDTLEQPNLELDLEILSFLVQGGDPQLFIAILKRVLSIIEMESDFQDVLSICADYLSCLDQENEEATVQEILDRRSDFADDQALDPLDHDVSELLKIVKASNPSSSASS